MIGIPQAETFFNHRLVGMRLPTSLFNRPIPIVYGVQRLSWNLMWYGDFRSVQNPQGGKGGIFSGGGSKSTPTYVYYSAVAAMLCQGPILGIGNVWDTQSRLTLNSTLMKYQIPPGGGTFNPIANGSTNIPPPGAVFYTDLGVSKSSSYNVVANDYGAPGTTTLTGTQNVPMSNVGNFGLSGYGNTNYGSGSAPAAGQYTVDQNGNYTFSAADAGEQVVIAYSWHIPDVNTQNKGSPPDTLNLTLFQGYQGQEPWGYLTGTHPGQDLGYSLIAYVTNPNLYLGASGQLPAYTFEILGMLSFGAGIVDCNPTSILFDLLTNSLYGLGWDQSYLDLSGTWSNASDYCIANSIFISLLLNSQQSVSSIFSRILKIMNCEMIWSGNVLKICTYGDTTAIDNGATFTPNTNPVVSLDDDDYVSKSQPGEEVTEDPIVVETPDILDAYNDVFVEYQDRGYDYNPFPVEAKDEGSIFQIGVRPMPVQTMHEITTAETAAVVAQNILQRSVYVRQKYKFTIHSIYRYLEPMDLVELNDSGLGLVNSPVRITSIEEDENYNLAITAEEFPWGTAGAILYAKQKGGLGGFDPNAVPGSINPPIMFEMSNRITGQHGYTIGIGICGQNIANWGGCHVWMSRDGINYAQVEDINGVNGVYGPSRMGVLTADFPAGSDPDIKNTCSVDLGESGGVLTGASDASADALNTMALINDEIICYSAAALVTGNQYNLISYIRRGQMGSNIADHPAGSYFLRLDSAVFQYSYDPTMIGQKLYFKFTSFNKAQKMEQQLPDCTEYIITPAGEAIGLLTPAHNTYRPDANPLTAVDSGTSVTIDISAFIMSVPGGPGSNDAGDAGDIPFNAGMITGLMYDTLYYIAASDPTWTGGTANYEAFLVKKSALDTADLFYIGSIQTPKQGAPPTIGFNDGGAGAQTGLTSRLYFSVSALTDQKGNAGVQNAVNAIDGDPTTYATLTATAGLGPAINSASLVLSGPPGMSQNFSTIYLKIIWACPVNTVSGSISPITPGTITVIAPSYTAVIAYANYSTTSGLTTTVYTIYQTNPGPGFSFTPLNLSQLQINILAYTDIGINGEQVQLQIYDAYLECTS